MLLSLWNYAKSVSEKYLIFRESKNQLSSLFQKNIYFLNKFIDTQSYRYRLRTGIEFTLIRTRIDFDIRTSRSISCSCNTTREPC